MTVEITLPRFVERRPLARGRHGYYWCVPSYWRKRGCQIPNQPLGDSYVVACGEDGAGGRARTLNEEFDEWREKLEGVEPERPRYRHGSVEWLVRQYLKSDAFLERVAERSRYDYERILFEMCDMPTTNGDRVGSLVIASVTVAAATKIYKRTVGVERLQGEPPCEEPRYRTGEKLVTFCQTAWSAVRANHPELFRTDIPNPWDEVTRLRRTRAKKVGYGREIVYRFAWGAIELGYPQAAAAAVLAFEFLQRPENALLCATWGGYRSAEHPDKLRIEHGKTGAIVWHALEEGGERFYPDAEAVLAHLPKLGPLMLMKPHGERPMPYKPMDMARLVQRLRGKIEGVPADFTIDSCRHGGMTELEEAGLTTGQGRALSGHRSERAYEGYAKETFERALTATKLRIAHRRKNAA